MNASGPYTAGFPHSHAAGHIAGLACGTRPGSCAALLVCGQGLAPAQLGLCAERGRACKLPASCTAGHLSGYSSAGLPHSQAHMLCVASLCAPQLGPTQPDSHTAMRPGTQPGLRAVRGQDHVRPCSCVAKAGLLWQLGLCAVRGRASNLPASCTAGHLSDWSSAELPHSQAHMLCVASLCAPKLV